MRCIEINLLGSLFVQRVLINRNMRCIEMLQVAFASQSDIRLIETWDVLKYDHSYSGAEEVID